MATNDDSHEDPPSTSPDADASGTELADHPVSTDPTASDPVPRVGGGLGLAVLRIVVGITWLHEASWKTPPDFAGLHDWLTRPLDNPTFVPWNDFIEAVILPNLTLFGWLTLVSEAALGGFLIVGLATRLWALVGLLQGVAIALTVISVPGEWSYAYYLFLAAHLALLNGMSGRTLGIDGLLRARWAVAATRGGLQGRVAWSMGRMS